METASLVNQPLTNEEGLKMLCKSKIGQVDLSDSVSVAELAVRQFAMQRYGQGNDLGMLRGIDPSPVYQLNDVPHRTVRVQIQFGWPDSPKSYWFVVFIKKGEKGWEKIKIEEESKMNRVIVYNGENGRANFCGCGCYEGGQPVNLPEVGQQLFSTGKTSPDGLAHQARQTLFLTSDRNRGMWVKGEYAPYIPDMYASPRLIFQKAGFTYLAMCSAGYVDYACAGLEEVAEHLAFFGSRATVKARLESFGFPAEYMNKLIALIPEEFAKPSEDDLAVQTNKYHCWGDVFMLGSNEMGEIPSFLFGWTYGDPNADTRTEFDRQWDETIPHIESGELPEPEFIGLSSSHPCKEIRWQGRTWRRDYEECPGKYNWVDTGSKWRPENEWYEVV